MSSTITEQYRQIQGLISQITNPAQRASLTKTMATVEADRIYIDTFKLPVPSEGDPEKAAGMFYVLGTMNQVTRKRERYQVIMCHDGTFECSCMDFRTNCPRQQKVCKHICFVVCKFGKIYDARFFNAPSPKALCADGRASLMQQGRRLATAVEVVDPADAVFNECVMATSSAAGLVADFYTTPSSVSQSIFTNLDAFKKWETDATCCICFDEVKKDPALAVACPECHNVMHRACMRIWIIENRHKTCAFCRDPSWRFYKG